MSLICHIIQHLRYPAIPNGLSRQELSELLVDFPSSQAVYLQEQGLVWVVGLQSVPNFLKHQPALNWAVAVHQWELGSCLHVHVMVSTCFIISILKQVFSLVFSTAGKRTFQTSKELLVNLSCFLVLPYAGQILYKNFFWPY